MFLPEETVPISSQSCILPSTLPRAASHLASDSLDSPVTDTESNQVPSGPLWRGPHLASRFWGLSLWQHAWLPFIPVSVIVPSSGWVSPLGLTKTSFRYPPFHKTSLVYLAFSQALGSTTANKTARAFLFPSQSREQIVMKALPEVPPPGKCVWNGALNAVYLNLCVCVSVCVCVCSSGAHLDSRGSRFSAKMNPSSPEDSTRARGLLLSTFPFQLCSFTFWCNLILKPSFSSCCAALSTKQSNQLELVLLWLFSFMSMKYVVSGTE